MKVTITECPPPPPPQPPPPPPPPPPPSPPPPPPPLNPPTTPCPGTLVTLPYSTVGFVVPAGFLNYWVQATGLNPMKTYRFTLTCTDDLTMNPRMVINTDTCNITLFSSFFPGGNPNTLVHDVTGQTNYQWAAGSPFATSATFNYTIVELP